MNKSGIFVIITILLGIGFLGVLAYQRSLQPSLVDETVYKLATDLGLNLDQFKKDYQSDEVHKLVDSQKSDVLARLGDQASTPAVFVDGQTLTMSTYDDLKTKLDAMIAQPTGVKFPVKVDVFVDYNCPHCKDFDSGYLVPLMKNTKYKDKVDFEIKNLPFLADSSLNYAWAAEAARKQGKFDDYSQHLFLRAQGAE